MWQFVELILQIVMTIIGLLLGALIGIPGERRHYRNLAQREDSLASFPVIDLKRIPAGLSAGGGRLVTGQVVMGSDYLKTFCAKFRNIFGGRVRSFERVMERARREALLRMTEDARQLGATAVINVRYETSRIGSIEHSRGVPMAEILCYGTAIFADARTAAVREAAEIVAPDHA